MTLPTRLDNCPVKTDGSAKGYRVIARAIGPWQSASPAMQRIDRFRRKRKNGLPRRFAPRNDSENLGWLQPIFIVLIFQCVGRVMTLPYTPV